MPAKKDIRLSRSIGTANGSLAEHGGEPADKPKGSCLQHFRQRPRHDKLAAPPFPVRVLFRHPKSHRWSFEKGRVFLQQLFLLKDDSAQML